MKDKVQKLNSINSTSLVTSANGAPSVSVRSKNQKDEAQQTLKRLLTVKEAAFYLSYDTQTVYEKVWLGEVAHIPLGKRGIRIDRLELDKYIRRSSVCGKRRQKRIKISVQKGGD